ncbi:MAG: endopeptidase La [Ruminococcaceae bacterium]|nr:endopeptidase La [Oscillospiraceae bacterium]
MDYNKNISTMPLLPLREITVFPGMMVNFDVERPMSVAALNAAIGSEQEIFLVTQKEIATALPKANDLYNIGTVCTIHQVLKIPGSSIVKVMVEGKCRARAMSIEESRPCFNATVEKLPETKLSSVTPKVEALMRSCINLFDEYSEIVGTVPPETFLSVVDSNDPGYVADYIAQNVFLKHSEKQEVLDELRPLRRVEILSRILNREINILSLEKSIEDVTKEEMNRAQRDYYLREQMRVIQRELGGEGFEDSGDELSEYKEKILALGLPKETENKLLKELGRLAKQPFGSSEGAVLRTYLDVCLEMPWNSRTEDTTDIEKAKKCLDEDHFGLEKVKDRIIEYLAVRQLAPNLKGSVLCLVGPPGVGKTSVAMSIARATNRKMARISLGGVHDEAEIRGHRKTYVGAMPGRLISGLQQAGSMNPVMVLDEIDKLGSDYKGDPSAALLEALDGEQNGTFRDNFLEIPVDLGEVFFITTANTTSTIPRALLDRMEVIELSSYTDEEKLRIAKDHLLPKQRRKHGLTARSLKLSDDAIREIIADYTRESGVRILEREIAAVCRKTARIIAEGQRKSVSIKAGGLESFLGAAKFKADKVYPRDEVGLVRGLAWTSVGGEVLDVEVIVLEGSGKLELTGNIGQVMQESAKAAVSYIRSRAKVLGIESDFYKTKDIHIHFPEGAIPKDGPSAGITITVALISALTGAPVRRDIAMTGEISLRGRVMAIGGLKEKTMAALRTGINTVIIPSENEKDLQEIDQSVRAALNFITTDHVDKILDTVLVRPSVCLSSESGEGSTIMPIPENNDAARRSIRQ